MTNLDKIRQLIPHGSEKPVTAKELSTSTGMNKRTVYEIIHTLVLNGVPVGGIRKHGKRGYFIITNENERQKAIAPLQSQINEMTKRVNAIKGAVL